VAANLVLVALGAWGMYFTWTRRHQSGGRLFFDLASSVRSPWAYRFAIGLRLVIFGLCLLVGMYRLVFGIVD
jgi:hypothetical protein